MADLIQAVIGYRRWAVRGETLVSAGLGEMDWQPGPNEASCEGINRSLRMLALTEEDEPKDPHPAPDANCGCGLYALRQVPEDHSATITGAIAAWGRIQVHHSGFRAERAQIIALAIPDAAANEPMLRERVERLAARYGCRAVPACDLRAAAREHGIEMPEELLPERPEELLYEFALTPPKFVAFHAGVPVPSMKGRLRQPASERKWPGRWATVLIAFETAAVLAGLGVLAGATEWPAGLWGLGIGAALVAGTLLSAPLYRLALRARCALRMFTRRAYHDRRDPFVVDNRFRMNLRPGDCCPECGWRLR